MHPTASSSSPPRKEKRQAAGKLRRQLACEHLPQDPRHDGQRGILRTDQHLRYRPRQVAPSWPRTPIPAANSYPSTPTGGAGCSRTSISQDYSLSVGGSLGNVPYRVNASYTDNQGIIIKTSSMQRTTAGFNLSPKFFNETLSINANASGSYVPHPQQCRRDVDGSGRSSVSPVHQTVPHLRRRDQGSALPDHVQRLLQQPQDHRRTRNIHRLAEPAPAPQRAGEHRQDPLQQR